jgi:PKD repeat protein
LSAQQSAYANDPSTQPRCSALYAQGTAAVQAPAAAYPHLGSGASAQAGAIYTGSTFPPQYRGALFIQDYNRDWIRYVTFDSSGKGTINNFGSDVSPNGGGPIQVVQGPDTNLYYVVLNFGVNASEIRRIRYTGGGNSAPTAKATATPTSGPAPLTVSFSSAGSFDPDGQTLTYVWDFGDGQTSTAANPTHTYNTAGTFTATLTVTDTQGASGNSQVVITSGAGAPQVSIASPANNSTFRIGDTISFSGSATDQEDGNLSSNLRWTILLHHNEHVHSDVFTFTGPSGSFAVQDHGDDNIFMELCASATDSSGLTTQRCVSLMPIKVPYTFLSSPSGMSLSYAGTARVTPFTVNAIVNAPRQIIAADVQNGLNFTSWSDGGARSHIITIQPTTQTLTATYGTSSYLSDLTPSSVSGSYRNNLSIGGRTLRLNGVPYARGVGVANRTTLTYNLAGTYKLFTADVGVDDETTATGSVTFTVSADGVRLFDSGSMNGNSATRKVSVNVTGRSMLTLTITASGNAKKQDISCDWSDARLFR